MSKTGAKLTIEVQELLFFAVFCCFLLGFDFLLQLRCRVAFDERKAQNLTAIFQNNIRPDDLMQRVIAAFDQYVRLDAFDEFKRRVFFKHNNGIHKRQRCE